MSPVLPSRRQSSPPGAAPFVAAVSFLPFSPVEPNQDQRPAPLPRVNPAGARKSGQPYGGLPPPQLQIPRAPLVGIARLAAQSAAAETKRQSAGEAGVFSAAGEIHPQRCDSNRVPLNGPSIPTGVASLPASIATRGTPTNTWNRWRDFEKKIS